MNTVPVAVLFAIQVESRVMIGESDLPTLAESSPERIPRDYLNGQFVFLAPGQPVVHLDDDLEFAAVQFLQAIPELCGGRPADIVFSDAPGQITLEPVGDDVRIVGDIQTFVAPKAELLATLLACCERFIVFARSALPDKDQVRLDQLEPWLRDARAALNLTPEPH